MTDTFANKVALVTGASARGIGGATAEKLAAGGAALALVSRERPERLIKRLKRQEVTHFWTECDITVPDSVTRAIDACREQFEHLDILINNAGIEVAAPFATFGEEQWRNTMETNLSGAARVTRTALSWFRDGRGAIVNVSSALALGGCPGFAAYSASKAGLIGWSQSLAWELAPHVRVNCVAPGLVATEMTNKHVAHLTPEAQKQIDDAHPLGLGSPHDVASAIAFLASDDARWITGATMPVGWAPYYPLPVEQFMRS